MLRRARIAAGLSQKDLARRVQVTPGAVSAWEAGEYMPKSRLFPKIAKILGVNAWELTQFIAPDPKASAIHAAAKAAD